MGRSGASRAIAALLVAGLASALLAPPPLGPSTTCSCCASGICPLADRGCDHRGPAAHGRLTSCCIEASERSGAATGERPPGLESGVLPIPCLASGPLFSGWRRQLVGPTPVAAEPAPERPPPRRCPAAGA